MDKLDPETLKHRRATARTKATKLVNELTTIWNQKDQADSDDLAYTIHQAEIHLSSMQELQEELDKQDILDGSNHVDELDKIIFKAKRLLTRLDNPSANLTSAQSPYPMGKIKLDFQLPTFKGDFLAWPEFWDLFTVAVHDSKAYSPVEKLVHLKGHLDGEAARSIRGLPTTGDNYYVAIRILKERYGKEKFRQESVMAKLLDMPRIKEGEDLQAMRTFVDDLTSNVRALETLSIPESNYEALLLPVLTTRIPDSWRLQWFRYQKASTSGGRDLATFLVFLEEEISLRQQTAQAPVGFAPALGASVPTTPKKSVTSVLASQQRPPMKREKWICKACNLISHGLSRCNQYKKMTVDDRWNIVRKAGLCFQCLGPHHYRNCTSIPCPICNKAHHSSLHRHESRNLLSPHAVPYQPMTPVSQSSLPYTREQERWPSGRGNQSSNKAGTSQKEASPGLNRHHELQPQLYSVFTRRACYSSTALVVAKNGSNSRLVRLLIDGGSDSSYIRESLADELKLQVTASDAFACIGFQEKMERIQTYDQVRITLMARCGGPAVDLSMWKTRHLCAPLQPRKPPSFKELDECFLADDFEGGPIDLLIGTDQIYDIVLWNQIPLRKGLRAIETIFGYVIHGNAGEAQISQHHQSYYRTTVEHLWSLDCLGITDQEISDVRNYPTPTWDKKKQRYEMNLVWKSDERPTSNFRAAKLRTDRMTNSLTTDGFREYDEHLEDLYRRRIIEYSHQQDLSCFFLPHRGIHRNGKLRVVFDGSAKDGSGRSLNSYLDPGVNLLSCLLSVIINFRADQVACQSDIKAAFHQILIKEEDRKYVQFLWADEILRFQRVPFGLSCSPFMLLQTIATHVHQHPKIGPELRGRIERGIYMDDLCLSFPSADEAEASMKQVTNIFADASMELHKLRKSGTPSDESNVLGLKWDTVADHLAVIIPQQSTHPSTKSELLSLVSRPFDPLGVLTPWLIWGKILFQETWKDVNNQTWSAPLSPVIQQEVERWWEDALQVKEVPFPRFAGVLTSQDTVFCVFCDASQKAYCAGVYAVHLGDSRLLVAKGRLAPLSQKLSIPRLELLAAFIGVKLMRTVCEALDLRNPRTIYWTDSVSVLCWIKTSKPLKIFVRNRVLSIRQLSTPNQWRYVNGNLNPADLGTRGVSLSNLITNQNWWRGPDFLTHLTSWESKDADPVNECELSVEAQQEFKNSKAEMAATETDLVIREVNNTVQQSASSVLGPFKLTDCSSLPQAVNRTAYILRFTHNVRHQASERRSGPLSPEERKGALHYWIRLAQERAYGEETKSLRGGGQVHSRSPLTRMRPHLDHEHLLRATLRTNEPPVIILPDLCHITTLIVDDAHRRCFHQGTRTTLALLAAEYMVRRRTVLRAVSACGRCRRYRGLPYLSPEGGLPEFRTQPTRAFAKVGIDYFGPMYIDSGGSKVWGLLMSCATTRAIHLEVVKSQSTDDLQLALRRFFALRGAPSLIISDNAKSFRKLSNQLPLSTRWRYIPEAAPWWGGFWERLVASVKSSLKITLHQCYLNFDELLTTFYELALHLNMRPLTMDDGGSALTPAHFVFGVTSIRGIASPAVDTSVTVDRAWRNRKRVSSHLTKRWTREYLQTLRNWSRSPRGRPTRTPRVGEIVLVHGETPRGQWPMARIESMIPGVDGHPRAATVRMRGIKTRRPLDKLYRLEATPPDSYFNDSTQLESLTSQLPDKGASNGDTPSPGEQECPTPSTHMTTRSGRLVRPPPTT